MDKLTFLVEKALSRRTFLAGAGSAAAAAVITGCSDNGTIALPATSTTVTDVDILNFALNLEYLEAEFYLRAATNSGLATADIGAGTSSTGTGAGTTVGGTKITGLPTAQQNILNEVAYTEQQHVRFLRSALGAQAVARPNLDLSTSFASAVTAANAISSSLPAIPTSFNPFGSFDQFLVGGFIFEDVGVTAYNGAAPLISTAGITAGYLAAAAGIMAVEAYHGALFRTLLTGNTITQGSTAYPFAAYANRISLLRAALTGTAVSNGGETQLTGYGTATSTVATVSASAIVPADSNALAYHRTTDQVLHIVYAAAPGAGVSKGGFFPNGLNGNITVTQS